MNFAQVVAEWEKDHDIRRDDLGDELSRSYQLHQKYLNIMLQYRTLGKQLEMNLATVKRRRTDFFTGRAVAPDPVSPIRVLKTEVDVYITADSEYQAAQEQLENARTAVFFLEKVMKMIEQRSWDIRASMDWEKYMNGGSR